MPAVVQWVKNLTAQLGSMRGVVLIPGPGQWVKGSGIAEPMAWIQSLAWELPYEKKKKIRFRRMWGEPLHRGLAVNEPN